MENDSSVEDSGDENMNSPESSGSDLEEIWDMPPNLLDEDIAGVPPLPEPAPKHRKFHLVRSLLQWTLYLLLIWQSFTHLSDNGLIWLLRFLLQFLKALNLHISDEFLTEIIAAFPVSLYMVRQLLKIDRDNFTKYVVCPKCTKCYLYDECLEIVDGQKVARTCSHTYYKRKRRHRCNSQLVKKITLKDKSIKYYPIYYYCYNGVINSLERLLQKKGFPEKCEKWRDGNSEDSLTDIYDGKLWNYFKNVDGKDFLNAPRNYGLMLNFDYFQPMKHRNDYSVGVFYLVVLNLPRAERFKWENVIVVGIVPSMDREPKCLNNFLQPAVDELKGLWNGLYLKNSLCHIPLKFRAAILCTSSDIPASRKLCGLKSHSGELGCSRCLSKEISRKLWCKKRLCWIQEGRLGKEDKCQPQNCCTKH